eukprot:982751_1
MDIFNCFVGFVLGLVVTRYVTLLGAIDNAAAAAAEVGAHSKPNLGDGCNHVFIDAGANIGVHSRFLFEPQKYPNSKTAQAIFERQFGPSRNNLDFCAFGFEPNPAHVARHKQLESEYKKVGWRYQFINAAISDDLGDAIFYHNDDEEKEEWGFGDHITRGEGIPVTVQTIRLSTWLQDEILNRKLPETAYGSYKAGAKVVMKMDIETLEYKVLPDLWFTGVLCETVDYLFMEVHRSHEDINYQPDESTGRGGLHLKRGESKEVLLGAIKLFNSFKHCKTTIDYWMMRHTYMMANPFQANLTLPVISIEPMHTQYC